MGADQGSTQGNGGKLKYVSKFSALFHGGLSLINE